MVQVIKWYLQKNKKNWNLRFLIKPCNLLRNMMKQCATLSLKSLVCFTLLRWTQIQNDLSHLHLTSFNIKMTCLNIVLAVSHNHLSVSFGLKAASLCPNCPAQQRGNSNNTELHRASSGEEQRLYTGLSSLTHLAWDTRNSTHSHALTPHFVFLTQRNHQDSAHQFGPLLNNEIKWVSLWTQFKTVRPTVRLSVPRRQNLTLKPSSNLESPADVTAKQINKGTEKKKCQGRQTFTRAHGHWWTDTYSVVFQKSLQWRSLAELCQRPGMFFRW